jgi:2-polyprenyl-3-methyl-5-hydroxy-6-metoxy-1,4-benzoquinol methylase
MKEFWDERYIAKEYFYGIHPNHFLTTVVGLLPAKANILSIGEGEGRNAVFLASLGFKVTAVDYSAEGKNKALALAQQNNVEIDYQVSDLEKFNFGIQKWDAIVSIFCHLPAGIRTSIHSQLEKSLRPNGLLILQAYNPKQLEFKTGGPKDISMLYTEAGVRDEFKQLEWIKLENSLTEISEGQGHQGLSSVLSGVGRAIVKL